MLRTAFILSATLLASACATTGSPAPLTAEAQRAAVIADLLTATADAHPDRIRAADAELFALEQALRSQAVPAAQAPAEPINLAMALSPAPDLSAARSVLSAVHLASYRHAHNAEAGWREFQMEAPDALSGLNARLAEVDLGERGVFLRLKAGPLDSPEAANALCAELEADGHWCDPVDFTGMALTSP